MPFTSRIFRLLESELNKNLVLSFSILENRSRPGSRQIRMQDRFLFRVAVSNHCSLAFRNVRGAIRPTSIAAFEVTPFDLAHLAAHGDAEIARIEARIIEPLSDRDIFDRIATVNLRGQADLSDFWFRDVQRPLPYSQPTPGGLPQPGLSPGLSRSVSASGPISATRPRPSAYAGDTSFEG